LRLQKFIWEELKDKFAHMIKNQWVGISWSQNEDENKIEIVYNYNDMN